MTSSSPHPLRERAVEVLQNLVRFPSVSLSPNEGIVSYIETYLASHGISSVRDAHEDGQRFNLLARIGAPEGQERSEGGILLSGHMDVVPADASGWSGDPFVLRRQQGRLIGRGAVDMKGFLAMALAMAPEFAAVADRLTSPLYLAFSFDEEIGCFGAERMPAFLAAHGARPTLAIVGEPTEMQPINAHKGGMELVTHIRGTAGHASRPAGTVNSLYIAARMIGFIEELARECAQEPDPSSPFDPPHSTLSVGTIAGGEARNIIPERCSFDWEIRALPGTDPHTLRRRVEAFAQEVLLVEMQAVDPDCSLVTEMLSDVPPLEARAPSPAADLVARLWTNAPPTVVSFGTDGAYFQQAGLDTVVFGPGGMAQMHQPDEFITEAEIDQGLAFLGHLLNEMTAG